MLNVKMKKILLFFVSIFVLIGCKKNDNLENKSSKVFVPKYGKLFFNYDEVNYYNINISENDAIILDSLSAFSEANKLKFQIISDEFPQKLSDINFEEKLQSIGFKKKIINKKDFEKLNKIFVEKTYQDGIAFACIPIFRDVLIFKKNKKLTGFAKICFDCHQYIILGNIGKTDNFGNDQDYENLGKILNQYSNN